MPTIGLIDDDTAKRGTLRKSLVRLMDDDSIEIVDIYPLDDPRDYVSWVAQNDIHAIVMDWRLNEQKEKASGPVAYEGDAVVKEIRKKKPHFPIFVLTAYSQSENVESHGADVELIESRVDFGKSSDKLIKRLVRAAARFSESQQTKLARISELAVLCAKGEAKAAQKKELRSLQAELSLGVVSDAALTQSSAIDDAQKIVDSADSLLLKIKAKLAEKKK
jgi:DNA-binding NarL/FixJ family response regulator